MNQRDDLGDATPGDWLALVGDGEDWAFRTATARVALRATASRLQLQYSTGTLRSAGSR
jgi:hypothetical protein